MTAETATAASALSVTPSRPARSLLYLYCILDASAPGGRVLDWAGIPGLDGGEPLFGIECEGLTAAVSRVPRATFLSGPLNDLVSDLGRVAPYALAHENAIRMLLRDAHALVPIAFGAVYRSSSGIRSLLREQGGDFRRLLDRVRNRQEWEVKVFCRRATVLEHVASQDPSSPDGGQPGRAYLMDLRRRRDARLHAEETLSSAIDSIASELSRAATEINIDGTPVQATADAELVCRIACLIEREATNEFCSIASALQPRYEALGLTLELNGPWAPYSFVRAAVEGTVDD